MVWPNRKARSAEAPQRIARLDTLDLEEGCPDPTTPCGAQGCGLGELYEQAPRQFSNNKRTRQLRFSELQIF